MFSISKTVLIARSILLVSALFCAALSASESAAKESSKIRVLIIDGQNNHDWAATTPLLKQILEESGRFAVEVSTSPPSKPAALTLPKDATPAQKEAHGENMKKYQEREAQYLAQNGDLWFKWRPKFSDYQVVVSNYNGEAWPDGV